MIGLCPSVVDALVVVAKFEFSRNFSFEISRDRLEGVLNCRATLIQNSVVVSIASQL